MDTTSETPSAVLDAIARTEKANVLLRTIMRRATAWWDMKRPVSYSVKEHLMNPTVNCVGEAEKDLASDVATYVRFCGEQ